MFSLLVQKRWSCNRWGSARHGSKIELFLGNGDVLSAEEAIYDRIAAVLNAPLPGVLKLNLNTPTRLRI